MELAVEQWVLVDRGCVGSVDTVGIVLKRHIVCLRTCIAKKRFRREVSAESTDGRIAR